MDLTIYCTRRGIALALLSPAFLVGLGAYGVIASGFRFLPTAVLTVGLILLAISLFDYPRRCHFGESGIHRVCFLRSQLLTWDQVNAVERSQSGFVARRSRFLRRDASSDPNTPLPNAGLVARVGGRRYLLTNRVESQTEWQALGNLIEVYAESTFMGAAEPAVTAQPTTFYRRKKPGSEPTA